MSMLKDLAEFLFDKAGLAQEAENKVAIVSLPGADGDYLIVNKDGTYTSQKTTTVSREHRILAVNEVRRALKWAASLPEASLVLWYDREGALISIDDLNRRLHAILLELETTDIWKKLLELDANERPMSHRDLMRLLRRDLAQWMDSGVAQITVNALKALDFTTGATSSSTQTAQKQGFGAVVDAEIRGKAGEIPEEILIQVPIYRDPAFMHNRYVIRLFLECDVISKTFVLKPLGDALDTAWDEATTLLGSHLEEQATGEDGNPICSVFFGRQ